MGAARKPQTQTRSKRITLRIAPHLLAEVTRAAEDDGRTVANWITWAIQSALKAKAKTDK